MPCQVPQILKRHHLHMSVREGDVVGSRERFACRPTAGRTARTGHAVSRNGDARHSYQPNFNSKVHAILWLLAQLHEGVLVHNAHSSAAAYVVPATCSAFLHPVNHGIELARTRWSYFLAFVLDLIKIKGMDPHSRPMMSNNEAHQWGAKFVCRYHHRHSHHSTCSGYKSRSRQ